MQHSDPCSRIFDQEPPIIRSHGEVNGWIREGGGNARTVHGVRCSKVAPIGRLTPSRRRREGLSSGRTEGLFNECDSTVTALVARRQWGLALAEGEWYRCSQQVLIGGRRGRGSGCMRFTDRGATCGNGSRGPSCRYQSQGGLSASSGAE